MISGRRLARREAYHRMIIQIGQLKFRLMPSEEPYMIGRAPVNDLVCNDPIASRMHAELRSSGECLEVRDLDSTNGTYLGEHPLPPMVWTRLSAGHVLSIGSWTLQVHADEGDLGVPVLGAKNMHETVTDDASGALPPGFRPTRESLLPDDLLP